MTDDPTLERVDIRQMTITHDAIGATLGHLSLSLARAANLHKEKGGQQEGVLAALRGVIRYLHDLNFPGDQIEPLDHIYQSLLDVKAGRRTPRLFTPDVASKNRAPIGGVLVLGPARISMGRN